MSSIAPGFDESVIVRSAELFYMLDGAAQLLSGEQVATAERGDLVVVPPGLAHALPRRARTPTSSSSSPRAPSGSSTSGTWSASPTGRCPPESLLDVQEVYDTYFLGSRAWDDARA